MTKKPDMGESAVSEEGWSESGVDRGPAGESGLHTRTSPDNSNTRTENQTLLILTAIITVLLSLHALYATRAVAFPVVLSVLIALPLRPVVRFLDSWMKIPRFLSSLICVLCMLGASIGASIGAIYWLAVPAQNWIDDAPDAFQQVERKLSGLTRSVEKIEEASEELEKITRGSSADNPEGNTNSLPETMQVEIKPRSLTSSVLDTTTSVLAGLAIAIGMIFVLLAFGDNLQHFVVNMLPSQTNRRDALSMMNEIEQTISTYLLTYTCINIVLGVIIGVCLWLTGLPNPVLWGVMACVLNYIPFVGLLLGTGVVTMVALVTFDSVVYAMLVPLIYLGVNGLEANMVTPCILGRRLQLNVILVFLSVVLLGWMWGIGGAIIAVPLLSVLKIFCDHFEPFHTFGRLLGVQG